MYSENAVYLQFFCKKGADIFLILIQSVRYTLMDNQIQFPALKLWSKHLKWDHQIFFPLKPQPYNWNWFLLPLISFISARTPANKTELNQGITLIGL